MGLPEFIPTRSACSVVPFGEKMFVDKTDSKLV